MSAALLPAADSILADLLATWGYPFDERHRVRLTKLRPTGAGDLGRVVKYHMPELRRLVGSRATQRELRDLLHRHFEQPRT